MTTNIQFVKMQTSPTMVEYTLGKLQRLSDKYPWVIRVNIFFKKENRMAEEACVCEMDVSLPGPKIFAKSNEKNFEMAVKETLSDVEDQLKKRKGKFNRQNISS